MWILEVLYKGITKEYHLVGGNEYTIGRKECDIVIENADASVSRTHVRFFVSSVPAGELNSFHYTPEIHISDESKHGTYVNGNRLLKQDARRQVVEGDMIMLGRYVELSLTYVPIVVCPSAELSDTQFKEVQSAVCRIGGLLPETPIPQQVLQREGISPFMMLFCTNEVTGEPRALLAMMCRYVLVNVAYLGDIFTFFRDGVGLSLSLLPSPGHFEAMRSPLLADAPYFRPEPAIFKPREFLTHPLSDPTSTFRGVHFLFLEPELFHKYREVADVGGGAASYAPPLAILEWHHKQAESFTAAGDSPEVAIELRAFAFRGIIGGPHVHGLNLIVVVPTLTFTILMEFLTDKINRRQSNLEIDETMEAYIALWKEDKLLLHEENLHIGVYTADCASQLQPTSPGVLCRAEMQAAGPHSDTDSDATEDGIQPYMMEERRESSLGQIVCHPAEQLVAKKTPPKRADSEEKPESAAASPLDLYERWNRFQADTSKSVSLASAAVATSRATPRGRDRSPVNLSALRAAASTPPRTKSPVLAPALIKSPRSAPNRQQTTEERVMILCNSFLSQSLLPMGPKVEAVCTSSVKANYLTAGNRLFLKTSSQRIANFLATLDHTLGDTNTNRFTASNQRVIQDAKARCETIQSAVEATCRHVGSALPMAKGRLMEVSEQPLPTLLTPSRSSARSSPMRSAQRSPQPRSPVIRQPSPVGNRSTRSATQSPVRRGIRF